MAVSCSKCSGDAVVYLPYGNENLCKKHFVDSFEKRVRRTAREFRMIGKGDRVGVAVSGGKDSVSMLYLLKDICDSMRVELVALSVDEGIEGYREGTLKVAKENCRKLGVEHRILSFKREIGITVDEIAKKKDRMRTCSYCGVFRRWILNKTAREMGLTKLAVGHNLDDAAQTVLMNFLRNEPFRLARFGPSGGIIEHEFFVDRIKPLIRIPERESAVYSIIRGMNIKFGRCPYAHEAFRNEVRVFLNEVEEGFPGTKFRVFNSFMSVRDVLREKFSSNETPIKCKECGELSSNEVCMRCKMLRDLRGEKGKCL
ncbi:MAG: TIGR00269 family protein [Candidatus Micrarchaeota archaeon]|nr:TIGR00269 family protein [Candidatus Micrarchaeota archaeon]